MLQNTAAEVQFELHRAYTIALNVLFGKVMLRSGETRLLLKVNIEINQHSEPILQSQELSVSFLQKASVTSLTVEAGDLVLNYSEAIMEELNATHKKYFPAQKHSETEMKPVTKESRTEISIVIKRSDVFFVVGDHNKFAKVALSNFVVSIDNGITFEGLMEIYDMSSYPYTRFVGEPRLIYQTKLSFVDMEIVLTTLKAVFMMEVTMRILDYVLTQLDLLLNFLNGNKPPIEH